MTWESIKIFLKKEGSTSKPPQENSQIEKLIKI